VKVNLIVFDSILDKSSTSSISLTKCSLLILINLTKSARSSSLNSSYVEPITSEKPTIAFSGVRISWLIFAKKAILSRSLSSAFLRASIKVFSISLYSWILIQMPTNR